MLNVYRILRIFEHRIQRLILFHCRTGKKRCCTFCIFIPSKECLSGLVGLRNIVKRRPFCHCDRSYRRAALAVKGYGNLLLFGAGIRVIFTVILGSASSVVFSIVFGSISGVVFSVIFGIVAGIYLFFDFIDFIGNVICNFFCVIIFIKLILNACYVIFYRIFLCGILRIILVAVL